MKLYEIQSAMIHALENVEIDEETGEVTGLDNLAAVELEAKQKIEATALYIREMGADTEALKAEIARLTARAKALETKTAKLKEYMSAPLAALGGKVKTPMITVSFRKSEAVEISGEVDALPAEFVKIKTTKTADKTALKAAIQGGTVIDGVTLVERQNVLIR